MEQSERREPVKHWAEDILSQIRNYMRSQNLTIKQAFQFFDSDGSNSVSSLEFSKALGFIFACGGLCRESSVAFER